MTVQRRGRLAVAQPTVPEMEQFLGDEAISIPTTAGGTALASVPDNARHAYIQNLDSTNPVMLRLTDGSVGGDPDSTHGIRLEAGDGFDLTADPSLVKLLAINDAVDVFVTYFGDA